MLLSAEISLQIAKRNKKIVTDLRDLNIIIKNPKGTGSYRYKPNLDLIYKFKTGGGLVSINIKTNSFGMRWKNVTIDNLEKKKRIAFIGDGYVAGSSADKIENSTVGIFDSLVNHKKYEVLNFGVFAYGLDDIELHIRESVLQFEPNYLFLLLSNGNDFRDTFLGINKYDVSSGCLPLWRVDVLKDKIPKELRGELPYSTWAVRKPQRKLIDRLELYNFLSKIQTNKWSLNGNKVESERIEPQKIIRKFTDFKVSNKFMSWSFWCRANYPTVALKAKDESIKYVKKINEICRERNIKLFLVSIPFEKQIYAKEIKGVDTNGIKYNIFYPQKYVDQFAINNSLPYMDLLPYLRSHARELNDIYPNYNDMHFSKEGRKFIAKLLFDFFNKHK